ncbi:MAG: hypothetical protein HGA85_03495 [Nanoarchaeota archaeon]|nr:hypothetical protein [Nanoarchaeota archaeon]
MLGLACVIMLYSGFIYAWGFVFLFCVLKTVSALGFCPGEKLYHCALGGGSCCRFMKHVR